ncbi:MAG TPA: LCP family protein [Candidatus Saccharimonadales bacterium]|nr:LCP family protein [Candidatus Saccharimonadales bacterium]
MKKVFIGIAVLVVIIGIVFYVWIHSITKKIFIPRPQVSTTAHLNTIQQAFVDKTPINILLLGYGGGNHDGAYLTDSIIAVHIDPKTQKVFLISIPRDIWIKIPTDGTNGSYSKINQAYGDGLDDTDYPNKQAQFTGADGGGRMAEYIIQQVIGIPMDYFVGMDFSGFTHTIDTLGGVDINVKTAFDDYQYPIEGQEDATCGLSSDLVASYSAALASPSATLADQDIFPCRYEHLHFNTGEQHMDGTTALKYVRSRHSLQDGTDFGRAERQRNLIVAVKQKVFSGSFIPQIIPFMTSLGDDLRTDLSPDDVKTLVQNIQMLNNYQIVSLALTDQNYLEETVSSDGQDILASRDGIDNWTSVHNWLKNEFTGKATPVDATIQIENGTSVPGRAQIATDRLTGQGLEVLSPVSAPTAQQKTTITIYNKGVSQSVITKLEKEFGVKTVSYSSSDQTGYNVLVIVGSDYNK